MPSREKTFGPDSCDPGDIPVNLKLRLEKCPKCGYERKSRDDSYATPFECPRCGVVYAAAMEDVRRQNMGQQRLDEAEAHERQVQGVPRDPNIHAGQMGAALFVGRARRGMWLRIALGFAALALLAFIFY